MRPWTVTYFVGLYNGMCPTLTLSQWSSSGNPVCLELIPQCTLECHWRNASVLPVVFQWSSSGFPVVFQCVQIMQIDTGSPLGHQWVLASASVVPVASHWLVAPVVFLCVPIMQINTVNVCIMLKILCEYSMHSVIFVLVLWLCSLQTKELIKICKLIEVKYTCNVPLFSTQDRTMYGKFGHDISTGYRLT